MLDENRRIACEFSLFVEATTVFYVMKMAESVPTLPMFHERDMTGAGTSHMARSPHGSSCWQQLLAPAASKSVTAGMQRTLRCNRR